MMRSIIGLLLALLFASTAMAKEYPFSKQLKASLVFREDTEEMKHYGYPHVLLAYLCLENKNYCVVFWAGDSIGVEAELFDSKGKPAALCSGAASIGSGFSHYWIPYGSRLDWLISHSGITLQGDRKKSYALIVGGRGWLIPIDSVESYSLRIRLLGIPWEKNGNFDDLFKHQEILLEVPATKLKITK